MREDKKTTSLDASAIYSDQSTMSVLCENEKTESEKCSGDRRADEKDQKRGFESEDEKIEKEMEEQGQEEGEMQRKEEDVDDTTSWDGSGIPYDHGWAWMVTFGSFVIFLVVLGHNNLLSVLLMDIMDNFHTSMTVVTVMFSFNSLSYSLSCQITLNVLVHRISPRKLFLAGTFANSLCTLLLVFVPNMPLFMAVNCLKFFSHGIVLMPSLTLVGHYFKRRRALASSLALLGMSGASLLCPLFVRYLTEEYGLRGCFLVVAGYEMHAFAAACLLRPISSYSFRPSEKTETLPETTVKRCQAKTQTTQQNENSNGVYSANECHHSRSAKSWDMGDSCPVSDEGETRATRPRMAAQGSAIRGRDVRDRQHDNNRSQLETLLGSNEGQQNSENKDDLLRLRNTKPNPSESPDVNSTNDLRRKTANLNVPQAHGREVIRTKHDRNETQSTSSLDFLRLIDLSSSLTASSFNVAEIDEVAARRKRTDANQSRDGKASLWAKCLAVIPLIFNFSIFRSWSGAVYIISYVLGRSVAFVAVYFPTYATRQGLDKTQAALLLTIYGGVDLVSRIIFGYLGDFHWVRPKYLIAASCIVTGLLACFVRLYTTFPLLIFCAAAMGFFGCVSLSLNTNNIIDLHGLDKLGMLLTMSSLCLSLGFMIQYPVLGVLIETTATFDTVFYYVAISYFVAATTSMLHEVLTRVASSRRRSSEQTDSADASPA